MSQLNTHPFRNWASQTARSRRLTCVSAPSAALQNSTPKREGQFLESISQDAIYNVIIIYCPWLPGLPQDTKPLRSCSGNQAKMLLKNNLKSNLILNLTRSSDYFSTVPPRANPGHWGCIVGDHEIILILLAYNFIPQRSHLLLTLTWSWLREYATLKPGDGRTATKVELSA